MDSIHVNEIEIEKEVENEPTDISGIQIAIQQKEIINDLSYTIFRQNSTRNEGNCY